MDPLYNTRTFVTTGTGEIEYDSEREGIVELVEDNDDQDRYPDTVRFDWLQGDSQVFPGWDQNNDFVPASTRTTTSCAPTPCPTTKSLSSASIPTARNFFSGWT